MSALAVDQAITQQFQRGPTDFKGFLSLYSSCLVTNSNKLKPVYFHLFAGKDDGAYHKEECQEFLSGLERRGVKTGLSVFGKGQWDKVGHLWDNMASTSNGWHGTPSGPWRLNTDKKVYGNRAVSPYGCELVIDTSAQRLTTSAAVSERPDDNELLDFVVKNCGTVPSVNVNRHDVTKAVDREIIDIIKNEGLK